ncbi:propionyl-CoA synthetase [Alteromonas gracilis]
MGKTPPLADLGPPLGARAVDKERRRQQSRHMGDYRATYDRSIGDPEGFWGEAAGLIDWIRPPQQVLDDSRAPFYRWFPDATLNTCHNAVDRHVEAGHGERTAIVYDSPVTDTVERISYADLLDRVSRFAGVLAGLGVEKGDRVIVYLPMIPEALVAMLACARLGAVHSVVFGGFAPAELAVRIDDARPKVVVTASCGIEPSRVVEYKPYVDRALELAGHRPDAVVLKQRPQAEAPMQEGRDHDWDEAMAQAEPVDCVEVAATDPLYVLYTSGTTGKPKGIVRDNGGHAVAMAWSLPQIYACGEGDVWWAASDVGWVVGHSYIVYAPLINGATTVLFEGKPVGPPDAGTFWRVIADHGVKALFTAPTAIRAIKKEDPRGELLAAYDLSSLDTLFLAGERLDPDTWQWATDRLGVPVVDNWWQTETGWPIAANLRGLEPMEIKPGSPSVPVPGYDVRVLDERGEPVPAGTEGAICLRLPMPPGTLPTLWGDDDRYVASYLSAFDEHYLSGDGGYLDEDGYVYVMGRTDDVINVAGHRLSTGSMEAVIATHPDVAECAVIGVNDTLKGQLPRGFIVLKAGVETSPDDLRADLVRMVREQIGAVASFREVDVVSGLPKTRSGKILRRTMREIADGQDPMVPSTIEDPGVLDSLRPVLRREG